MSSFLKFLNEANAAGSKFEQKIARNVNAWIEANGLQSKFKASRFQKISESEDHARDEDYSDVVVNDLETGEQIFIECKKSIKDNIVTTQFDVTEDFTLQPVNGTQRTALEDELSMRLAQDLQQTAGFQQFVSFLQEHSDVLDQKIAPADFLFNRIDVNDKTLHALIKKYNKLVNDGETEADCKTFSTKLIRESTRNMLAVALLWRIDTQSTWDICCAEDLQYFGQLIKKHYSEDKTVPAKYLQLGDNLFVVDADDNPLGIDCPEFPSQLAGKFYLKFTPRFGTGAMYITPRSSITDDLASDCSFDSKDRWPRHVRSRNEAQLSESYVLNSPDRLQWVSGTSIARYDTKANNFFQLRFNFNTGKGEIVEGEKTSIYYPLFFTSNLQLAIKYSKQHVSGDFAGNKSNSAEFRRAMSDGKGQIVFVSLKPGVELFDFNDPQCFEKIGIKKTLRKIFNGVEPYFAFNLAVKNSLLSDVPVEFDIAKKMFVMNYSQSNKYKSDGSVNASFFQSNSFMSVLEKQKKVNYSLGKNWREKYQEFLEFYNLTNGDVIIAQSKTGRKQVHRRNADGSAGSIVKDFPQQITQQQCDIINLYFKMFAVYVKYQDLIPKDVKAQLRVNLQPKFRIGFMDLLQACLHVLIYTGGYCGYYCPEYRGAKSIGPSVPAIALFDDSAIAEMKSYDTLIVSEMYQKVKSTSNATDDFDINNQVRSKVLQKLKTIQLQNRELEAYRQQRIDREQKRQEQLAQLQKSSRNS